MAEIAASPAPAVSVIVPAYNAAATLQETLESVLAQTFTDFELLVVDDGSTDATAQIALSFEDPRVRLISLSHGGVARARNLAVEEARGTLVAFLDADDVWLPHKLQLQVALLDERPDVGLCVTRATRIDADSRPTGEMPILEASDDYTAALLLHSSIAGGVSAAVIRRELFQQVGGFPYGQRQAEDWDLWLRLSLHSTIAVVPESLVLQRAHAGNTSGVAYELERDTFPTLDRFFASPLAGPYSHLRKRVYARHWMICSGSYLHQRQLLASLRCLVRGLATSPGSVRQPLGLPMRWLRRARRRWASA